ncbi:MAG: hypothetical protein HYS62_03620 [Candidatus Aenigmarchaeota archaeon]|nr:hypothetical protein [Candidatus Aenigmarchaeota archaeon]
MPEGRYEHRFSWNATNIEIITMIMLTIIPPMEGVKGNNLRRNCIKLTGSSCITLV